MYQLKPCALATPEPGLPDGIFSDQKVKIWRVFQWKMLVYFMAIWSILWPFGLF
jgi:hypothetical protein